MDWRQWFNWFNVSLDLVTTATMPRDVLECTVTVVDAVGSQAQGADTITIEIEHPMIPLFR